MRELFILHIDFIPRSWLRPLLSSNHFLVDCLGAYSRFLQNIPIFTSY